MLNKNNTEPNIPENIELAKKRMAQHSTSVGAAVSHAVTVNLLNALTKICNADKIDAEALEIVCRLIENNINNFESNLRYFFYDKNVDFAEVNECDTLKILLENYDFLGDSRISQQEDL